MNEETPKVSPDDLVKRDGITYKKFTNIPFTGSVEGVPKGTYRNGKRDGVWEMYHLNGQLWMEGTYKDGKKEGVWEEYEDDGQLYRKGSYADDKRDGVWEFHNENGSLSSKTTYKDGEIIKTE